MIKNILIKVLFLSILQSCGTLIPSDDDVSNSFRLSDKAYILKKQYQGFGIEKINELVDSSLEYDPYNYEAIVLKAWLHFKYGKSNDALELISIAQKLRSHRWEAALEKAYYVLSHNYDGDNYLRDFNLEYKFLLSDKIKNKNKQYHFEIFLLDMYRDMKMKEYKKAHDKVKDCESKSVSKYDVDRCLYVSGKYFSNEKDLKKLIKLSEKRLELIPSNIMLKRDLAIYYFNNQKQKSFKYFRESYRKESDYRDKNEKFNIVLNKAYDEYKNNNLKTLDEIIEHSTNVNQFFTSDIKIISFGGKDFYLNILKKASEKYQKNCELKVEIGRELHCNNKEYNKAIELYENCLENKQYKTETQKKHVMVEMAYAKMALARTFGDLTDLLKFSKQINLNKQDRNYKSRDLFFHYYTILSYTYFRRGKLVKDIRDLKQAKFFAEKAMKEEEAKYKKEKLDKHYKNIKDKIIELSI